MIPGSANPLLLATAVAGGYSISRSVRFNSSDSAYLSRTPASAGNRKTWTWAGWVKRSNSDSSNAEVFGAGSNNLSLSLIGDNINVYEYNGSSTLWQRSTTAVYRDFSAWYHVVLAYDTTQATASNRIRLYINGAEVTQFSTNTNPTLNFDGYVNNNIVHYICYQSINGRYFNGYLADIHFIDGQALDPTSFGEFSATTGVWVPKAYSGTYGTNGFKLSFSDNSTTAALGTDTSGNGNTWTVNNISVTAGAGNDSLVDVPVNGTQIDTGAGGEVRGNYCTLNPLSNEAGALSNGNLQQAGTSTANVRCNSTIAVSSGKWYFESTLQTAESFTNIGIGTPGITTQYPGQDSVSYAYVCEQGLRVNAASTGSYGNALTSGDILMVAFDLDNNKIFFGKNGSWFGSSDPAAGTNPAYTITAGTYCPITRAYSTSAIAVLNFGQRPFAYTAPSGFKALCTANLPAPVVTKPSTVMDVKLYTGNGSTQTISTDFSPDFLWFKARGDSGQHALYDIVRGASKSLVSNSTASEATEGGGLSSFDSAGFSLSGDNTVQGSTNGSGRSYVAWAFDAGSSTVTNTAGSISSQVRANASAGFSVFSASISAGASGPTIGHGLGVIPGLVLGKNRSAAIPWYVWHSSFSANQFMKLNSTDAVATSTTTWGNITSSTVQIGATGTAVNVSWVVSGTQDFIFYAFAPVAGYSAFGSYTGNGSADGPFVYTGFRPRWILWKCTTAAYDWDVYDAVRDPYNAAAARLKPNSSDAEATLSPATFDILSNGFKLRQGYNSSNASGQTYIYFAVAESPFQYARAR